MKIVIIGAGSFQFGPRNIVDIVRSRLLVQENAVLVLMDINPATLNRVFQFATTYKENVGLNFDFSLEQTGDLRTALANADFVITAIELDRYKYWAQDFHIPRDFGFRQVYAENGGPRGLFHALRNFQPMLKIARTMEELCPDAWLLNFTNPESKIIELVSKASKIKSIGLCHGIYMGIDYISRFTGVKTEEIDFKVSGLNHFGWFTSIRNKKTGESLYPLFAQREKKAHLLAHWDELALLRILYRTFGLWPYPGTNHCGEYIGWAQDYLAGAAIQYFSDPVENEPWDDKKSATFVYSMESDLSKIKLFSDSQDPYKALYTRKNSEGGKKA